MPDLLLDLLYIPIRASVRPVCLKNTALDLILGNNEAKRAQLHGGDA